jgi:hypothetical protein
MSESEEQSVTPNDGRPAGHSAWQLSRELVSLEARLAALSPRDDRLDRERLMFLAGQASVVDAAQPSYRILGIPFGARVWPPAFAAMTAIAASLLFVLLLRPATIEPPRSGVRDMVMSTPPADSPPRFRDERTLSQDDVRSTSDALDLEIERLLASRDVLSTNVDSELRGQPDGPPRPSLTPASWRQIFDSSPSDGAPKSDSTNIHLYRGVNS